MNISYRWLKRFLAVDLNPKYVDELLTDTGLEVEGLTEVESIKGGLKGVVVGQGTHDELLKSCPLYKDLWTMDQKLSGI